MTMTSNFLTWEVIVNFFWLFFFSLVKFSYWSKFHVNIITGSGVMTISFYKRFTRNPEIGKNPRRSFAQYLETGASEWRIAKLARTSLIKCYWILQNARVTAFTVSKLLRENQQEDEITRPPPTQIRIKEYSA